MLLLLLGAAAASPGLRLVEYYAPWCPVCQRFESEFLKLASDDVFNDTVEFVRVDCDQLETHCATVGIDYYPTLLLMETSTGLFLQYNGGLTYSDLRRWLQSYALVTGPSVTPQAKVNYNDVMWGALSTLKNVQAPVPPLIAHSLRLFVHDLSEFLPELNQMAHVLAHGRPLEELSRPWAPDRVIPIDVWQEVLTKAPADPRDTSCGSSACAVWTMLHTLVVSVDDPAKALQAAAEIVVHTLPCKECARHFNDSIYGDNYETALSDVHCDTEAALWLWNVHNQVNTRIGKPTWPGPNCTTCGTNTGVYDKLVKVYKVTPEPKSSPSVVVATSALAGPITLVAIQMALSRNRRAQSSA